MGAAVVTKREGRMQPGWHQDPSGRFPLRWHDGTQWTPQVMDGWQRPAIDPLAPAPTAPAPTAPAPTAPAPTAPAPTAPAPTAAPAPAAAAPPAPEPAATPVPPAASRFPPAGRYALIGVAAVLMVLGLFVLPWINVYNGHGTTAVRYPKFANAVARYGGGDLNWWQHLYGEWFAVVLAAGMLTAVTVTVAVVAGRPAPAPRWTWALCLVAFALEFGNFWGVPDFPALSGASVGVLGVGSVALGYLLLALACPTPPVGGPGTGARDG